MSSHVRIAIVGSGPGGLSAAAHAAELGIDHVLLEKAEQPSDTIQKYQKGKHVMAEPAILPLRSPLNFEAGTREEVLEDWCRGLEELKVSIRYKAEVIGISHDGSCFQLELRDAESVSADAVILGIGVQGNPRRLGCEGEDQGFVQYQLDDPAAHKDEAIVVVGAGDAAIENAIALSKQNRVYIVNRRDEFARAKKGNLALITEAIDKGVIECYYNSSADHIEVDSSETYPAKLVLKTDAGQAHLPCDRIIARLGAIPQRALVESFGIEFPSDAPEAIPQLSPKYESNVPGLYVIGALGGYPLIKQAMNQGYEAVEHILGKPVKPADHPLLQTKFQHLDNTLDVDETLALMQSSIPIFRDVNALLFRELMLESEVLVLQPGELVFNRNDYTNSFLSIFEGSVEIRAGADESFQVKVGQGRFFGEMSLLSGRRRSATAVAAEACILIETPRRSMVKLINSNEAVRRALDEVFILRAIQSSLAPGAPLEHLEDIAGHAKLEVFQAGDVLFAEGDVADKLHFVRSGSLTVSKHVGGRDVVLAYVPANHYVGEIGLLADTQRNATVRAAVRAETISLDRDSFARLLELVPDLRAEIEALASERMAADANMSTDADSGDLISFLMQQGLGTATDVLLINEDLCVACDNCERACAESHDGNSRLDRAAGPSYASVHVPTSCRHCEDPKCMTECPPDAIRRSPTGEVYIEDSCIGCGNCARNCPFDVIQMAVPPPPKPGLWSWMLFGAGPGPGQDKDAKAKTDPGAIKKAVKCDMCKDLAGGPACVRACPTGAAIRISPEQFGQIGRRG